MISRRHFLASIVPTAMRSSLAAAMLLAGGAATSRAAATSTRQAAAAAWNALAEQAHVWIELFNSSEDGVISAKELRAWRAVKEAWGPARRSIDEVY